MLEDINLYGAKGLLVNITAGPDMAIGEFEAVGNAINEFAAPDANVVIGTAFDPSMEGDLRVTMVATGLVDAKAEQKAEIVEEEPALQSVPQSVESSEQTNQRRLPPKRFARAGAATAEASKLDMDYLDIPAFLRRQAD